MSMLDFFLGCAAAIKGISIDKAVEIRRNQLMAKAPASASPGSFQIQPDGEVIHLAEDESDDQRDDADELTLRKRIGEKSIQRIIRRVQELGESRSQLVLERAEKTAQLDDLRSSSRSSMIASSGEYEHNRRNRNRLLVYLALVGLPMLLFDAYTVADYITHVDVGNLPNADPVSVALTLIMSPLLFSILVGLASLSHGGNRALKVVGISLLVVATISFTALRLQENFGGAGLLPLFITFALGVFFVIITGGGAVLFELLLEKFISTQRWLDMHNGDIHSRRQAELQLETETRAIDERIRGCEGDIEQDVRKFENAHQGETSRIQDERQEAETFSRRTLARLATVRFGYLMGERTKKAPALKPVLVASIIIPLLFLLFGCGYYANRGGADYEVITDQSTSVGGHHISSAELAQIGDAWIADAEKMDGGRFEILIVGKSFDDVPVFLSQQYPQSFPVPISYSKLEWKKEFIKHLTEIADSLPNNGGSAIAEAIYRASLRIPDNGETKIIVCSDLREVNKRFDLERSVPTYTEFANWLKEDGITPIFPKNTRLWVIGVHPYSGPNTSTLTARNYDNTIRLWEQVFKSWKVKASISETLNLS